MSDVTDRELIESLRAIGTDLCDEAAYELEQKLLQLDSLRKEMQSAKERMWETGHENERLSLRLDNIRRLVKNWMDLTPEDHTLRDEPHGGVMADTGRSFATQVLLVLDEQATAVEKRGPLTEMAQALGVDMNASAAVTPEIRRAIAARISEGQCPETHCELSNGHDGNHVDEDGHQWCQAEDTTLTVSEGQVPSNQKDATNKRLICVECGLPLQGDEKGDRHTECL